VGVSYRFEFDRMNGILRLRHEGPVSGESLIQAYKATPTAVQRCNPRAIIIDLSQVTSFDVSSHTIHEVAGFEPTVPDPGTPRIIVAPTAYLYGMSRMFQILGAETRPQLQVVQSQEAAYAELDVAAPGFEVLPLE
jgi:hypothetical protein